MPDSKPKLRSVTLTLPLPFSWNSLYNTNRWGDIYLSAYGKEYKEFLNDYIQKEMNLNGDSRLLGDVVAQIWIAWPNNKAHDPENIGKLLFDTLKDLVFEDDCHMFPQYQCPTTIDVEHPRVTVIISETGDVQRDYRLPPMPPSLEVWQQEIHAKYALKRKVAAKKKRERKALEASEDAEKKALAGKTGRKPKALKPPREPKRVALQTITEGRDTNDPTPIARQYVEDILHPGETALPHVGKVTQ